MNPDQLYDVLKKYADSLGIQLNNDREFVLDILAGLLKNEARYGYRSCPCRLATGFKERDQDIICPCRYKDDDIREFGSCYCGLYVSLEWNEGSLPHTPVPERRRPRK
ncbi:MAG TPA: ferredoxin-thioredoxin reductase catalytic domain-containing protein [Thermodesulfovibrionales bacterium]|nr:ferredoxin-thioredoxin reductase catalytic domain-containing protein [Thermodesulfovibrionales bacterium]